MTDVDEDSAAHVVIRGTHEQKTAMQLVRIYMNDDIVHSRYRDRLLTITGPKGSGFAEELTIYHKARLAKKTRLVLSICYTLRRKPAR